MAWVKIPAENNELMLSMLPKDARVTILRMFGGVGGKINGHMFAGTFGRSVIVRLSDADHSKALALDGAVPFDPMDSGRPMNTMVLLPEDIFDEPAELRSWIKRALEHTATLQPKKPAPQKMSKPAANTKPVAKAKPVKKKATK